ncbi:hypothetical protein F4823DRAFT_558313 [Ustulina deusta]|nr:hypothetical protein F4823DRAFT_558313 [Ustulina deusta]
MAWRFRDTHTDPSTKALTRLNLLFHNNDETKRAWNHLPAIIERIAARRVSSYDGYDLEVVLYIPARGATIDATAEITMGDFECCGKRSFDVFSPRKKDKAFACDRLEEGEPAKAISQTPNHGQVWHASPYPFSVTDQSLLYVSSLFLTVFRSGDIANVFDKCLPRLIGGFEGPVSLRKYLENSLQECCASTRTRVEFFIPPHE